jgi:hypothetical protein
MQREEMGFQSGPALPDVIGANSAVHLRRACLLALFVPSAGSAGAVG